VRCGRTLDEQQLLLLLPPLLLLLLLLLAAWVLAVRWARGVVCACVWRQQAPRRATRRRPFLPCQRRGQT
jgi:hypothetical protein